MLWFQSCGLKIYLVRQHYQNGLEICFTLNNIFPQSSIHLHAHRNKYLYFIKAYLSTELTVARDATQKTTYNDSYLPDNQTSITRKFLLQLLW